MATLYRKYRPQSFQEVVNQNHIKLTLEHEIERGKIAHAYLFCGPRAVGKTTLARVFAKAVNCLKRKEGEHEPCNKCSACLDITAGRSFDIIEIDAASHTGVDNVRDNIIAAARVAPAKLKYKVFIIDEIHMLSASAFNALLKTIEEPPPAVIFILCTTEINKVPTTIISRCQRFDFKKISISDVVKKLEYIARSEDIKINKSILESIARQSEGHMRDAESLLGQVVSMAGKEITQEEADLIIPRSNLGEIINFISHLAKKDAASALRLINFFLIDGIDLKIFLDDLIEILRKMMIAKINPALLDRIGLDLGESLEIKINEVSGNISLENIVLFIEEFQEARKEIKKSGIPQLPVELAIIKSTSAPVKNILPDSPISRNSAEKDATAEIKPLKEKGDVNFKSPVALKEILDKWNEVLARIKKYNHSLSFILRVCEPKSLENNKLCLAFKYKFHKDRMADPNISALLEKVLAEMFIAPISVISIIDEKLDFKEAEAAPKEIVGAGASEEERKAEANSGDNVVNNFLKTFGGRVVN
jgi:DNA polymerase-3 subunit gamma/tau